MSDYKQDFLKIYDEFITRDGAAELREYLCKTDFFTAPASSRYHSAFSGGLCFHSIKTYERLKRLVKDEWGDDSDKHVSEESVAILGLLHDLCKIEYYKSDMRNTKVNGEWVQVPYYSVEEKLPYGHGEKSSYIINGFLRLTREEALAINWHMGGFDARCHANSTSMGETFDKYPIALLLHIADMQATYIDENRH